MSSVFDSLNVKYHKATGNMRGEFRQEVRAGDIILTSTHREDFPGGTVVKNLRARAVDVTSISALGRSHMPRSN